jgi:hypothetical protein
MFGSRLAIRPAAVQVNRFRMRSKRLRGLPIIAAQPSLA